MKYVNFLIFSTVFLLLMVSQSFTQLSTSLLSVLPEGESKALIKSFEQTENSKILLVAVKGFEAEKLAKIKTLEKKLTALASVSSKELEVNAKLQEHQEIYKLFTHKFDEKKLEELNISKDLNKLYTEMTTSFFPLRIDKLDPFELLIRDESRSMKLKNAHLTLGDHGYLSIFKIKSSTLDEHRAVYEEIHRIVAEDLEVKLFSPLFYYVENSQAIMSDVNKIIFLALGILLLLYLFILKDMALLLNTLMTLGTSGLLATMLLTQFYDEVSIFVFVFGISISTIAIDYMFHHYVHAYYSVKKSYNREVLFGFLTTLSAFFILSFSSFLLIKQITIFAMLSLSISYLHFAFLYPRIGFKTFEMKKKLFKISPSFIKVKSLLLLSVVTIFLSFLWIEFDFNLKNLDYDNRTLKEKEAFFVKRLDNQDNITFAVKAKSINELIMHTQQVKESVPSVNIPLAQLLSRSSYQENKQKLERMDYLRNDLQREAEKLGFKKEYFKDAYGFEKSFINYTFEDVKAYDIDIVEINDEYLTYGRVSKELYAKVLDHDFVKSLSVKEHFEASMRRSITQLLFLGLLALASISILLYLFTKKSMLSSIIFLVFPLALIAVYAIFLSINILHIFMLFVILAIGVDYAIYMSKSNDELTKRAISYSLISTFSGFGVLIFSTVNALFSIGVVATIGVFAIFVLLLIMKEGKNVS